MEKELYYVTIYKLEGHTSWRVHSSKDPEAIDREAKNNKWPQITERNVLLVSRIDGSIKPQS